MFLRAVVVLAGAALLGSACAAPKPQATATPAAAAATQPALPASTDGNAPGIPTVTGSVQRTASGLGVIDTKQGSGAAPQRGQTVSVHYTGWLTNGRKFDSSRDRGQPFQFTLGAGQVIPGWDEGVASMRVGGMRRLIVPPQLGYGPAGYPGVIPGNATLIFDVELLSVQ